MFLTNTSRFLFLFLFLFLIYKNKLYAYDNFSFNADVHYGYGKLLWHDKKPVIYPLASLSDYTYYNEFDPFETIYYVGQYYKISLNESKRIQEQKDIYAHLQLKHNKSLITANVTLHNKSNSSYYVHRMNLPANIHESPYSPLCSGSFLIVTNNIRLDYIRKITCRFDLWMKKSDWIEISPGEKLSYTVNLNDYYAFLPAKHQYDIGTVEFTLVNSNWFLEQHIYDLFFAIVDERHYKQCKNTSGIVRKYIYKSWQLCETYRGRWNPLQELMNRFHYEGGSENIFQIRTNQENININGDKIKSLYSSMQ